MSWSLATLAPDMAKFVSDSEFDEFTAYLILFPLPKMILGLVGFTALGVSGWRRRAIPRGAAALLILAGVASLWWAYPPGALLGALAFAWIVKTVEAGSRGPQPSPGAPSLNATRPRRRHAHAVRRTFRPGRHPRSLHRGVPPPCTERSRVRETGDGRRR